MRETTPVRPWTPWPQNGLFRHPGPKLRIGDPKAEPTPDLRPLTPDPTSPPPTSGVRSRVPTGRGAPMPSEIRCVGSAGGPSELPAGRSARRPAWTPCGSGRRRVPRESAFSRETAGSAPPAAWTLRRCSGACGDAGKSGYRPEFPRKRATSFGDSRPPSGSTGPACASGGRSGKPTTSFPSWKAAEGAASKISEPFASRAIAR
jgi:hypothetical protein